MSEEILLEKKGAALIGITRPKAPWYRRWVWMIRGNGRCVLTPEAFRFERWAPKKIFDIPMASIRNVEIGKSHAGKASLWPVLKVTYEQDGEEFCIGVIVASNREETEKWEHALKGLMRQREQ